MNSEYKKNQDQKNEHKGVASEAIKSFANLARSKLMEKGFQALESEVGSIKAFIHDQVEKIDKNLDGWIDSLVIKIKSLGHEATELVEDITDSKKTDVTAPTIALNKKETNTSKLNTVAQGADGIKPAVSTAADKSEELKQKDPFRH
jgi:response regulator RpfG family c-di-GMP phosphodiesterase